MFRSPESSKYVLQHRPSRFRTCTNTLWLAKKFTSNWKIWRTGASPEAGRPVINGSCSGNHVAQLSLIAGSHDNHVGQACHVGDVKGSPMGCPVCPHKATPVHCKPHYSHKTQSGAVAAGGHVVKVLLVLLSNDWSPFTKQ